MKLNKKIFIRRLLKKKSIDKTKDTLNKLEWGKYGIITKEPGLLTENHKEATRKIIAKNVKVNGGFYWSYINAWIPLTQKSKSSRMGKGRGAISQYKYPANCGNLIFEFQGVNTEIAKTIFNWAKKKLPIKTKLIICW